jgi:toxin-antitoxin system PIN domain toxin
MLALDVNVLVYAHRRESADHALYVDWLSALVARREPFALPDLVCAGFVRIVTHQRIWRHATEPSVALDFVARLRRRRSCRILAPGAGTWAVFARLVASTEARSKLVADAYLAALAIENGCTLVTCDGDFARFPDLRWTHPLQAA